MKQPLLGTIRRGTSSSVADLTDAIVAYASILDKVGRARAALDEATTA